MTTPGGSTADSSDDRSMTDRSGNDQTSARPLRAGAARLSVGFVILLVRLYQGLVRPLLIGSCKFHPTCSEYAIQAVCTHGALRGLWLAVKRIVRCVPFTRGGYDPVPAAHRKQPDRAL